MYSVTKYLSVLLLAAMTVACGPSKYTMHLEMRQPSKVGVELSGKTVSVVYLEDGNPVQDGFNSYMAEGFAYSLEEDYGTGDGSIAVYRMSKVAGGDYASKDTLANLVIDTGSDVVFLFDTTALGEMSVGGVSKTKYQASKDSSCINTGSIPFTLKLYCYDSMNKSDEVKTYGGTSIAQPDVYSDGSKDFEFLKAKAYEVLPAEGWTAGELVADSFKSQWKVEGISIAYFDSSRWITALEKADQFDWKGAMDIWFGLSSSNDVIKRACAAYNIAVACYMSGDYRLAAQWLDLSDKENKLPLSDGLRKRIDQRL